MDTLVGLRTGIDILKVEPIRESLIEFYFNAFGSVGSPKPIAQQTNTTPRQDSRYKTIRKFVNVEMLPYACITVTSFRH